MRRIIMAIVLSIGMLMTANAAQALTAESSESPDRLVPSRGKIMYNYNIQEVERDADGDGTPETIYRYNYVIVDPPATKQKILDAIGQTKTDTEFDSADLETEQDAVMQRLAEISQMSYTQIDAHIDNTFSGLSEAQKASLKKLYKAVLALIKQLGLE
jgi:hypothetical protein